MSSDPIEVLREVVDFLCGVGELDGRNFGDAPPYDMAGRKQPYWWREHLRQATAPFLASLSCRYPDCGCRAVMGSTGATEVCPLAAPRPESAEAVAWAYRSEDPYNAGEWIITSIGAERPCRREVRPLVYGDTAPPRPEASAPVGVEDKARAMFEAQADRLAAPWDRQWEPTKDFWRKCAAEALAQQPAACDHERSHAAPWRCAKCGHRYDQQPAAASGVKLPDVPFAVFDEFGVGADDRIMDYGRACAEAALAQQPAADFDAWQKNPYTKVLMKSVDEDYVPKHGQQPAAVDGAMVEQLVAELEARGWDIDPDSNGSGLAELRDALTAALAGRQQGGEP